MGFECGKNSVCPIQGIAIDIMGPDYCEKKLVPMFKEVGKASLVEEADCPAQLWHDLGLGEESTAVDLGEVLRVGGEV